MNYLKMTVCSLIASLALVPAISALSLKWPNIGSLFCKETSVESKETPAVEPKETKVGIVKFTDDVEYEYAEKVLTKIHAFSKDPSIQGIVLVINSSGGDCGAGGLLFREVQALAARKPVVVLAVYACSMAYQIAIGGNWIVAPALASVGNIGIVQPIQKYKNPKLTNNKGVSADLEYDFIHAGKYKVSTNPQTAPLSQEERVFLQEQVNALYKIFLASVAQQRGLSLDKATEWADAKVFTGEQALALKLIDQVGGFSDAVQKLTELMQQRGVTMQGELQFVE